MIQKKRFFIFLFIFVTINLQAANFYDAETDLIIEINEHSSCKNVKNTNAKKMFIPTKTAAEWSSFRSNIPTGVDVTDCCPTGFVAVPGDSEQNTEDFCVMQYEAKDVTGTATSQAGTTPWASITIEDAEQECRDLGTGYHLINNYQWQTIARNAEYQDANWSGGARGVGCLNSGNNSDTSACGYDGSNPEYGTGRNAKAKITLSNGSEIWDFAGNMMEHVRGGYTFSGTTGGWVGAEDFGWPEGVLAGADKLKFGPKGSYLTGCTGDDSNLSQCGVGYMYMDGTAYASSRGGVYNDAGSDMFYTHMGDYGSSSTHEGFRCVYNPNYSTWESYSNGSPADNGDFEDGDFTSWTQTTGDDGDWVIDSTTKYAGSYSASAPASLADSETTCIQRTVNLTAASNDYRIQWIWKTDSEAAYDYGVFYVDDVLEYAISGSYDWYMDHVVLAKGSSYTIKFCYEKDSGTSTGSDKVWVDNYDEIEL